MFISFVHLLSSKTIAISQDRVKGMWGGRRGGGGGVGGGGWTGRILEPAVGDDENAGKPSSWHNLLQFFWLKSKVCGKARHL